MSAKIIDGKAFAANLTARIGDIVRDAMAAGAARPGLAVVLVGNCPSSEV